MAEPTMEVPIPGSEGLVSGEMLDQLVQQRQLVKQSMDEMKGHVKEFDVQIGTLLDLNNTRKVVSLGQWVVSKREASKPRKSIDALKLLQLGVSATIIQQATVFGEPGKPGIAVRRIGGEAEGTNNEW